MDKEEDGFKYVYIKDGQEQEIEIDNPGDKLMPLNPDDIRICAKIDRTVKERSLKFMSEGILPRSLFKIESNFVEENPERVLPYTAGITYDKAKYIKLLTNDKAGKMGRATWFLADRDVIETNKKYVGEWQVVVSSANAGGQKRDNQLAIIDNNSAFGRSRVALKSFGTRDEAVNFHNYVCSNLVKYAFLMTDESLTSLGKRVPDIVNYKSQDALIDFHGDINQQLYQLFGFTEAERDYIEQTVSQFSKSQSKEVR